MTTTGIIALYFLIKTKASVTDTKYEAIEILEIAPDKSQRPAKITTKRATFIFLSFNTKSEEIKIGKVKTKNVAKS